MQTNEMYRKSCPILQISYMYEIQIFLSSDETDKIGDWEKIPLTKLLDYVLRVHLSIR